MGEKAMQEISYNLVKEDYQEWIHWNVERGYSAKRKYLVYGVLIIMMVLMFAVNGEKIFSDPKSLTTTGFMVALVAVIGIRGTSKKSQEKMLWRRSGLEKMERQGRLPHVIFSAGERACCLKITNLGSEHYLSYREMESVEEMERLIMVKENSNTWQIIAKSGFESEEEMKRFLDFLKAKVEDAKANPDNYPEKGDAAKAAFLEEIGEAPAGAAGQENVPAVPEEAGAVGTIAAGQAVSEPEGTASEADIATRPAPARRKNVDTSNMGKLGKMAHFVNPEVEDEEESAGEEASAEETAAEENAAEETDVKETVGEEAL